MSPTTIGRGCPSAMTTLAGVDAAPAQTWNHLAMNDTTLEVPAVRRPTAATPTHDPGLPASVRDLECGAGKAATAWLDEAATSRTVQEVPAGTEARVEVDVTTRAIAAGDADASSRVDVAQTTLLVHEGAIAHVSVVLSSVDAADAAPATPFTCGSVMRIEAERDARVDVTYVVALDDASQCLASLGAHVSDGASLDVTQHVLGAATCALGTAIDLAGDDSRADVDTHYLVGRGHELDLGHVIRQRGQRTRAVVDASGVLADGSAKALRATLDLRHGCKGSRGREQESVILAGDDVINRTLPVILCDEDDVAADHGATIGSIAPEQMVYLADRGLTPDDVAALVTESVVGLAAGRTHGHARKAVLAHARRTLGTEVAQRIEEDL